MARTLTIEYIFLIVYPCFKMSRTSELILIQTISYPEGSVFISIQFLSAVETKKET